MLCYFLLTYTVADVGKTEKSEELAEDVRRDIRKISDWDNVEHQQTTFTGLITVSNDKYQRESDAIKQVTEEIEAILNDRNARRRNIVVYCTMMLEDTFGAFHFEVSI